jgi:hypothetical protein
VSNNPEEEQIFRDLWEDETQREVVIESLKAYSVRSGGGGFRVFEGYSSIRSVIWRKAY